MEEIRKTLEKKFIKRKEIVEVLRDKSPREIGQILSEMNKWKAQHIYLSYVIYKPFKDIMNVIDSLSYHLTFNYEKN